MSANRPRGFAQQFQQMIAETLLYEAERAEQRDARREALEQKLEPLRAWFSTLAQSSNNTLGLRAASADAMPGPGRSPRDAYPLELTWVGPGPLRTLRVDADDVEGRILWSLHYDSGAERDSGEADPREAEQGLQAALLLLVDYRAWSKDDE